MTLVGAPCTVCKHPLIADIDFDLLQPGPQSGYTRTARTYGLHKDAVRRHKQNGHVASVIVPRMGFPQAPSTAAPMTAVESLSASLQALNAVDTKGMTTREMNLHTDLKRKVAVDLAKYQVAVDREGPAQKELRALSEMQEAMDDALERFPEARAAVAQATMEWKARRDALSAEQEGS